MRYIKTDWYQSHDTYASLLVQVDWHQLLVPENWSVCMALYNPQSSWSFVFLPVSLEPFHNGADAKAGGIQRQSQGFQSTNGVETPMETVVLPAK